MAKAYVQIIPSAQGIKQQLTDILGPEVGGAGDAAGKSLGNTLISSVKTIIAAAGIGSAIKEAFSEGANLQQSLGGVETLFKENADQVKQYANEAYKTAGLSANEYMESVTGFSASLLQSLGGDTEKAAEAANTALIDMSDNANKMGTSMELIQNAYQGFAKQNYTMLDNLKLGYGGTKTEMERLLSDAEKFSGVKYDISNLSDVYEAIHVIQNEMEITGTTAKEGATTFSGALASMKASATNLLGKLTLGEDIGAELSALQETFSTFFFNNMIPMVGNILSNVPGVIDGVLTMVIQGINKIASNSDEIVEFGINFVTELADCIVYNIPYLLETAWYLLSEFGRVLVETDWMAVASNLLAELQGSMELAAGEIFGTDNSLIIAFLQSIQMNLPLVLEQGVEFVSNLINGIIQSLPQFLAMAGELITQFSAFLMQSLPVILDAGVQLLLNLVNGILDNLPSLIETALQVVLGFVQSVLSNLPTVLESGIQIIAELAAGILDSIPKVVSVVWDVIQTIKDEFLKIDWLEIGINILEGIKNGLINGLTTIANAAKEVAKKALDSAKEFLGIASPSKEFFKIGEFVTEGFANGIMDGSSNVDNALKKMTSVNMKDFALNATSGNLLQNGNNSEAVMRLAKAIAENPTKVIVTLEGDAKRMFRIMQRETEINQTLTGQKV